MCGLLAAVSQVVSSPQKTSERSGVLAEGSVRYPSPGRVSPITDSP
jgi:hypothetical protein